MHHSIFIHITCHRCLYHSQSVLQGPFATLHDLYSLLKLVRVSKVSAVGSWTDVRAQMKAELELKGQQGSMVVTAADCSEKIGQRGGEVGQAGGQWRLQTNCLQKCKLQCKSIIKHERKRSQTQVCRWYGWYRMIM